METEYVPGSTVEDDAKARLGLVPLGSENPIEQTIAVRIPNSLRHHQSRLSEGISGADFDCIFSGDPSARSAGPGKDGSMATSTILSGA